MSSEKDLINCIQSHRVDSWVQFKAKCCNLTEIQKTTSSIDDLIVLYGFLFEHTNLIREHAPEKFVNTILDTAHRMQNDIISGRVAQNRPWVRDMALDYLAMTVDMFRSDMIE